MLTACAKGPLTLVKEKKIVQGLLTGFKQNHLSPNSVMHDDQNVFISTKKGKVLCLDQNSLKTKWKRYLRSLITSNLSMDDNNIYLGTDKGMIYALDKNNGQIQFRHQADQAIMGSVIMDDGILYHQDFNSNLYANDLKTQNTIFKYKRAHMSSMSIEQVASMFIEKESLVATFFDGSIVALNKKTGEEIWTAMLDPEASAAVTFYKYQNVLFASQLDSMLIQINMKTGKILSMENKKGTLAKPFLLGQDLYVAKHPNELWVQNELESRLKHESSVDETISHVLLDGSLVFMTTTSGNLEVFDEHKKSFKYIMRLPIIDFFKDKKNRLWVVNAKGNVFLFQHLGKQQIL